MGNGCISGISNCVILHYCDWHLNICIWSEIPSSHMLYLICSCQNPAVALMLCCKGMPAVKRVAGMIPIIYQNTRLGGHIILNLLII